MSFCLPPKEYLNHCINFVTYYFRAGPNKIFAGRVGYFGQVDTFNECILSYNIHEKINVKVFSKIFSR